MQKAAGDGLETVQLEILGTRVLIRIAGERSTELAQAVKGAWDWCLADEQALSTRPLIIDAVLDSDPDVVAGSIGRGAVAALDLSQVMHLLSPRVTVDAISRQAGRLLMFHACSLADPDSGAAVVMVGPSGMGKTTLSRALGTEFGYLSDETAAVDATGSIVPYPKPLSILSSAEAPKSQVSPSALGLRPPPVETRVAAVVFLDRRPDGPTTPVVETVPTVHALALLAEQTSYLARLERPLQRIADLLHGTAGLPQVTYREAADLRPVVRDLIGGAR